MHAAGACHNAVPARIQACPSQAEAHTNSQACQSHAGAHTSTRARLSQSQSASVFKGIQVTEAEAGSAFKAGTAQQEDTTVQRPQARHLSLLCTANIHHNAAQAAVLKRLRQHHCCRNPERRGCPCRHAAPSFICNKGGAVCRMHQALQPQQGARPISASAGQLYGTDGNPVILKVWNLSPLQLQTPAHYKLGNSLKQEAVQTCIVRMPAQLLLVSVGVELLSQFPINLFPGRVWQA